jgi:hypothetical protein
VNAHPTSEGRRMRPRAFGAAAVWTSLVVGTLLSIINHPEVVRLDVTRDIVVKSLLNYLVPFLVAGYSRHVLLRRLWTHRARSWEADASGVNVSLRRTPPAATPRSRTASPRPC